MAKELDDYFEFKCRKGFDNLKLSGKEYTDRLDYEISCIKKMGFSGYLLIVQDLLNWATRNDILCGPGRGSAAGSLVCYVLGITKADPIRHGLIFERFLNPDRISMPDIDMDFEIDRRDEVVEYVKAVYGTEKVARITTFSAMNSKGAIRDVARAMDLSYVEADKLSKTLVDGSVKHNMENNLDFANLIQEDVRFREVASLASRLEGNIRHSGIHAAGVVIGDKRLDEYMPVYTSKKTGDNLTQFAMNEVEEVGLIKFDFLGLKNLSIIHMTQDLVKERHDVTINLDDLTNSLDDEKVFKLFANGDTTNVFQFESDGMKKYLIRTKVSCFEDIAAMNALYRPAGLDSGIIDDYIARKNDPSLIEYPHECLEPYLKGTLGLMVFQENQMKVCEVLAGYTAAEADSIRKYIGKKKLDKLKKERPKFVKGCMSKGLSKADAEGLFDDLEKAGRYSFNASHSVAYSIIAYWTAWLKVYYPLEYMAAVLSYELKDKEALFKYVSEAKRMGIEFLAPDVNKSLPYFSIEDNKIRYALAAIEGIGVDTSEEIVKKREKHGDFFSIRGLVELTNSKKVTSQVIENLIKSGGMDVLKLDKDYMLELIEPAVTFKKKKASKEKKNQLILFERVLELDDFKIDQESRPPKAERDKYETEALGFFLFDNPLKDYTTLINENATHTIAQVRDCEVSKDDKNGVVLAGYINSVKKVKRKKDGAPMAFIKLSDGLNEVEVCVFTTMYHKLEPILNKNALVMFSGQYKCSDNGGQLIAKGGIMLDDLPKLKTDSNKGFFNFTLSDGTKIILEAKEKLTYIPKLRRIFDNCKEGIN